MIDDKNPETIQDLILKLRAYPNVDKIIIDKIIRIGSGISKGGRYLVPVYLNSPSELVYEVFEFDGDSINIVQRMKFDCALSIDNLSADLSRNHVVNFKYSIIGTGYTSEYGIGEESVCYIIQLGVIEGDETHSGYYCITEQGWYKID